MLRHAQPATHPTDCGAKQQGSTGCCRCKTMQGPQFCSRLQGSLRFIKLACISAHSHFISSSTSKHLEIIGLLFALRLAYLCSLRTHRFINTYKHFILEGFGLSLTGPAAAFSAPKNLHHQLTLNPNDVGIDLHLLRRHLGLLRRRQRRPARLPC